MGVGILQLMGVEELDYSFGGSFEIGYRLTEKSHIKGVAFNVVSPLDGYEEGYDIASISGGYLMYSHYLWLARLFFLHAGIGAGTVEETFGESLASEEYLALETGIGLRLGGLTFDGTLLITHNTGFLLRAIYTF